MAVFGSSLEGLQVLQGFRVLRAPSDMVSFEDIARDVSDFSDLLAKRPDSEELQKKLVCAPVHSHTIAHSAFSARCYRPHRVD
eukprot:9122471-Pyramimonas_sp.AAC.1